MGQVLGNLNNPNVMGPQPSDLSGGEWATRIGAGALKGLGTGLQNYSAQQGAIQSRGGGGGFSQVSQPGQIQFPVVQPKKPGDPFYGGGA